MSPASTVKSPPTARVSQYHHCRGLSVCFVSRLVLLRFYQQSWLFVVRSLSTSQTSHISLLDDHHGSLTLSIALLESFDAIKPRVGRSLLWTTLRSYQSTHDGEFLCLASEIELTTPLPFSPAHLWMAESVGTQQTCHKGLVHRDLRNPNGPSPRISIQTSTTCITSSLR